MNKYCCKKMEGVLEETGSPIKYEPYTRYYFMEYHTYRKPKENDVFTVETVFYCPWCGKKLPKDLVDEWENIVKEKFGIIDTLDKEQLKKIPQAYMTEEWWKKLDL